MAICKSDHSSFNDMNCLAGGFPTTSLHYALCVLQFIAGLSSITAVEIDYWPPTVVCLLRIASTSDVGVVVLVQCCSVPFMSHSVVSGWVARAACNMLFICSFGIRLWWLCLFAKSQLSITPP